MELSAVFPLSGFLVGLLVGLTGMGGAALMTPFLILVLGTRPVVAVGTNLAYGALTKLVGALLHWRQGTVDLPLVKRLALGSLPAGLVGVAALRTMPTAGVDADDAVRRALGAVLILVAAVLLTRILGVGLPEMPDRWRRGAPGQGHHRCRRRRRRAGGIHLGRERFAAGAVPRGDIPTDLGASRRH